MPSIRKSFDPRIGPIITFGIAKPNPSAKPRQPALHTEALGVSALVDTGAARTCVTEQIARKAGLRVMGKTSISSVHGTEDANVYLADILLFVDLREDGGVVPLPGCFTTNVPLVEFVTNSPNFDALLGRDLLCLCDFRMTRRHEFFISH